MNYIDWNTWSSNTHPSLEWYRMKRFWAQIIDSLLSLLIIPIFINIYYYCRYWYTLWKKIMNIRVVNQSDNSIPTFKSLLYRHHYKWGWFLSIFYITLLSILIIVCVYLISWINNLELYRESFESGENYSIIEWFILLILFLPVIIWQLIWIIVPFHLLFKSNWIWLHDKLSQTKITQFDNPRINNNQRGRGEYMKMLWLILTPFLWFAIIWIYSVYEWAKDGNGDVAIHQEYWLNPQVLDNDLETWSDWRVLLNWFRYFEENNVYFKFHKDWIVQWISNLEEFYRAKRWIDEIWNIYWYEVEWWETTPIIINWDWTIWLWRWDNASLLKNVPVMNQ